jgi:hydrogenase maturation protein HypF
VFRVRPEVIAHDLHPGYFTTHYAQDSDIPLIGVQHHHAHIVSCMVDNGLEDRRLIGLAFDGAGYGADGRLWGGEVLLASFANFERLAHLEYLPRPGDHSIPGSPWRIAASYAHALGIEVSDLPFLRDVDKQALRLLGRQVDRQSNSLLCSSMGCLFDAVAGLIGVRNDVTYEAQAALEMEALSRPFFGDANPYPYLIEEGDVGMLIRLGKVFESIVASVRAREPIGWIGARFHQTIAAISLDICRRARRSTGLHEVALSGGVWQNRILLHLVRERLTQAGFVVYVHQQVPANDGGLSLGQAVIANYLIAKRCISAEAASA